jgi:hypothetical protein
VNEASKYVHVTAPCFTSGLSAAVKALRSAFELNPHTVLFRLLILLSTETLTMERDKRGSSAFDPEAATFNPGASEFRPTQPCTDAAGEPSLLSKFPQLMSMETSVAGKLPPASIEPKHANRRQILQSNMPKHSLRLL